VSARPLAVIDTNVALDLLVFGNGECEPLRMALDQGLLQWIACETMRAELAAVLVRGFGPRWKVDPARVLDAWDRWAVLTPEPPHGRLRCTDADDQKFIDLALERGACWLLTRDRALLKLARRARERDVVVQTPDAWSRRAQGGSSGADLGVPS
jgi:predicted nucleic acid-binding protein